MLALAHVPALALPASTAMGTTSQPWPDEPAISASQYQHVAWLARDGAPAPIRAIAQTDDGYLWLGTEEGLYRFDGQSFELIPTPGGASKVKPYIGSLLAEPGGGLWIGFRRGGGLGYLKAGKFSRFETTARRDVDFLSSAVDGSVWFQLGSDLYRQTAGRIEAIGPDWNLDAHIDYLAVDRRGNVWVADAKGRLLKLAQGATRFELIADRLPIPLSGMVLDGRGNVWGPGVHGIWHVDAAANSHEVVRSSETEDFGTMMFDRDGALWVQRVGGILRESNALSLADASTRREAAHDVFSLQQGLSSETVWAMLQDRDGNVWLGTSKGLDRFRRTALTPVKLPRRALSFVTAPAGGGALWAANFQGGLMKINRGRIQEFAQVGPGIRFIYPDPRGSLWVGGGTGLWRSNDGNHFERVPVSKEFIADSLRAVSVDMAGGLWIAGGRFSGVRHVVDGEWHTLLPADGFPANWNASAFANDERGRVWGNYLDDVLVIENGKAQRLSSLAPGLDIGRVITLSARGGHMWLGGYSGVAVFDGHRVVDLTRRDGASFTDIGGIVELPNGDVWLHDRIRAMRIPAASVAAALAGPARPVEVETFSEGDGLYGSVSATSPLPSLTRGDDGRLWFSSDAGLAWLDPDLLRRPERIAPVRIRALLADGASFSPNGSSVLPPRNQHTEIAYTAIALSTPERVRFRYLLEGIGSGWQDVGSRRTAYFNNLAPGRYRFRVEATDEYGRWTGNEAVMEFRVGAAWYQTSWFRLSCAAAVVALGWSLFRLRIAQVSRQLLAREDAKQLERARIARDLHDTFLQSVQALIMQFHALSGQLSPDPRVQEHLRRVLDLADEVLDEGRDRVIALRKGVLNGALLADDIERAWQEISVEGPPALQVQVQGRVRPLSEETHRETLQIVREALVNVCRHARASRVDVTLVYERGRFAVRVADDGVGMAQGILRSGKAGHWGLAGMRERATEMRGTLLIRSDAATGTTVSLEVRAGRAYAPRGAETVKSSAR